MKEQINSNIEKWSSTFLSLNFNLDSVKELLNWTYNNINQDYKLIVVDSPLAMLYAAKAVTFFKEKRPKIRKLNTNIGGIIFNDAMKEIWTEKFEVLVEYDNLKRLSRNRESVIEVINRNLKVEHSTEVIDNVKKVLSESIGINFNTDMLLKAFNNEGAVSSVFDDALTVSNFSYLAIAEVVVHKYNIRNENFERFCKLVQSANIFAAILSTEYAIICKPPVFLNRDERHRLNCTHDGAVMFADNYKQFYVEGINFEPKQFDKFFKTKDFTGVDILKLRNVEQKAVIIQEYGYDKILEEVDATVIDTYKGNSKVTGKELSYQLFEFQLEDSLDSWGRVLNIRLVQVECHTTHHKVTLGVPTIPQTNTCLKAIAWTFNLTEKEYKLNYES